MTKIVTKNVRVHTCYSIELNDPRPVPCNCRKMVTVDEAEEMVRKGAAQYVVGYDRPKPYEDGSQICETNRMKRTPRGATIEKAHMERAYPFRGDIEEKVRIEMYGLLTLLARISNGKKFIPLGTMSDKNGNELNRFFPCEPNGGRENDWGQSVLFLTGDGRSKGTYASRN